MIIGFSGKKGHGKDTCAEIMKRIFVDEALQHFTITRFAQPITDIYKAVTGIDYHSLPYGKKEEHRGLYIKTAEAITSVHGKGWTTKIMLKDYKPALNLREWLIATGRAGKLDDPNAIISPELVRDHRISMFPKLIFADVRLIEEARAIQALGGVVIRVHRDGRDDSSTHFTEVELDGYPEFDFVITNNGTKYELEEELRRLYPQIRSMLYGS